MRGNGPLDGEAVGVLLDLTPRSYLRQLVVRWSKEDRIKHTGRGMYQNLNSKETRRAGAGGTRFLYSNRLRFAYGDSGD